MKKSNIAIALITVSILGAWRFCTPHYTKLGETAFYKSENLELKVVTRHEYLPLHYIGDTYTVACKSKNTEVFGPWPNYFIDKGWNVILAPSFKSQSADEVKYDHKILAQEAKKYYEITEPLTIQINNQFRKALSTDGCSTFQYWDVEKD